MILVEQTPVPVSALPIAAFRDHLRLGTGFADDAAQDAVLESMLRSALSTIETRTGKTILRRTFIWQLTAWRGLRQEELPTAPVTAILGIDVIEPDGSVTSIDPARYSLVQDSHRPTISARGLSLPTVPVAGRLEIRFEAGFAPDWPAVPNDLKQAVFILAADYYETRGGAGTSGVPPRVLELLAPYRPLRLFGRRL